LRLVRIRCRLGASSYVGVEVVDLGSPLTATVESTPDPAQPPDQLVATVDRD
jgi:hypothetical protein